MYVYISKGIFLNIITYAIYKLEDIHINIYIYISILTETARKSYDRSDLYIHITLCVRISRDLCMHSAGVLAIYSSMHTH